MPTGHGLTGETIQADVEPGDKTGVYYTTLCNLPFGTTWQGLKDWMRSACDVDHVEVFPNSTSGWVRVKGKDNFENAWKLLNGGTFNGRSIIASDKNRTEPIKIKELAAPISQSPSMQYGVQYAGSYEHDSSVRWAQYPSVAESPHYPYGTYNQHGYSAYDYSAGIVQDMRQVSLSEYNAREPQATIAGYSPPFQTSSTYTQGSQPIHRSLGNNTAVPLPTRTEAHNAEAYYEGDASHDTVGTGLVYTEPRKILIKHIERTAEPSCVKEWIQEMLGKYAIEIAQLELPAHESGNQLRGHAYIVFSSIKAAQKGIKYLDGQMFQRRRITARLTVEGVAVPAPDTVAPSAATARERASIGESGSKKGKKRSRPVVVDGSSRRSNADKR